MYSSNHDLITNIERLLTDHARLLERHLYLKERLTSIQRKIQKEPLDNHEALTNQEKQQLDAAGQRLKELQNDPWLDKLFSVAKNESQVHEIEKLMQRWGQASYDSVAHCIVDHANRHRFYGDYLKYLRKSHSFNKKRSRKRSAKFGATKWTKRNNEFLIERDGKIVSYGMNRP